MARELHLDQVLAAQEVLAEVGVDEGAAAEERDGLARRGAPRRLATCPLVLV